MVGGKYNPVACMYWDKAWVQLLQAFMNFSQ